jgi:hypothetical protein
MTEPTNDNMVHGDGQLTNILPGDVFVIRCANPISDETRKRMEAAIASRLPGDTRILILDAGLQFDVVRPPRAGDWYLAAMNDGLFIIDQPPRPSNDHPWHDRPDGPGLAIPLGAMQQRDALAIVEAHNAAIAGAMSAAMLTGKRLNDTRDSFNNAIAYALDQDGNGGALLSRAFLDLWVHGEFDAIASAFPDFKFGNEKPGHEPDAAGSVFITRVERQAINALLTLAGVTSAAMEEALALPADGILAFNVVSVEKSEPPVPTTTIVAGSTAGVTHLSLLLPATRAAPINVALGDLAGLPGDPGVTGRAELARSALRRLLGNRGM